MAESDWEDIAVGGSSSSEGEWEDIAVSPVRKSDLGSIGRSAIRGLSSTLGLIDEIAPGVSSESSWPGGVTPPHLFGLFGTPKPQKLITPTGFSNTFETGFKTFNEHFGLDEQVQPATEIGRFAENVSENAAAAAPFGPLAMLASAVLGGTGGYVGETIGGPTGRSVGSFLGGVSPSAINKLGIAKEVAEQVGPVVSQFPFLNRVLGRASTEAAVGRAISKQASDLSAVEKSLAETNAFIGPRTELDSLKTTDEIVGDVGLARATDATENLVPNAGFKQLSQERAAVREAGMLKGLKEGVTDYKLSKNLEDAFSKGVDDYENAIETPLWTKLDKDAEVSLAPDVKQSVEEAVRAGIIDESFGKELIKSSLSETSLEREFQKSIQEITFDGAVPLEGQAKGLVSLLQKAKASKEGVLSIGQVQELRRRALQVARANKNNLTAEGQMARDTASAVEKHLRDIVDANATSGTLASGVVKDWEAARDASNFKFTKLSAQKEGTKGLETVGLKGGELDNVALINEGLRSPDKLASHLEAAKLGGKENVKVVLDQYRQSLLNGLKSVPQRNWEKTIAEDIDIWKQVFTPKELARFKANTDDVASWVANENRRLSTNSATNTRGNIQDRIKSEKGLAALGPGAQSAGTVIAAGVGAKEGWDSGETTLGGLVRGVLGGFGGAVLGKTFKGSAVRASEAFDDLLVQALKDPRTTAKVIEAAKPGELRKALTAAGIDAAKATGAKGLSDLFGRVIGKDLVNKEGSEISFNNQKETDMIEKLPVAQVIEEIKSDPVDHAIMLMESGGDPNAKNPESSASGLFQLIKKTAGALGVKDVFDPKQNYEGYKKLKAQTIKEFNSDSPEIIYAAHYLGVPTLKRWREGKSLTEEQQAQVEYLQSVLLPKLQRIYQGLTGKEPIEA